MCAVLICGLDVLYPFALVKHGFYLTHSLGQCTVIIDCAPIGFMDTVGTQALLQVIVCVMFTKAVIACHCL